MIIAMVDVYNLFPGHVNQGLVWRGLHVDIWWGSFLIVLGGFYTAAS
jgi:hypothetical protein